MAPRQPSPQSPVRYEIRVEGVLGTHWTAWFGGLQVSSEGSQTVISGPLPDQPALHGVLVKVRDLGLNLISVLRLDPDGAEEASPRYDIPIPASSAPPARPRPEGKETRR